MKNRAGWRESLREAGVVIGSILVAFALDASWDGVQDNAESQAALSALRADFVAAQALARAEVERSSSVKEAAAYLLEVTHSGRAAPADSIQQSVHMLQRLGNFGYPTGAYDTLLGAGRLSLLKNKELRLRLADFVGYVDLLREIHLVETRQWLEIHQPFWSEHADVYAIQQSADGFPGVPSRFNTDWSRVLELRRTSGLLSYRWVTADDTGRGVRNALRQIEMILSLIDEGLEP